MKRFFVLFSLVAIFATLTLEAQMKYKASEGLTKSKEEAELTFTNPKLVMVGTMNTTINFQGFPFTITFDMETGTATAWVYMYMSEDGSENIAVGVVKVAPSLFVAMEIETSLILDGNNILDPTNPIGDVSWMDSPDMSNKLKETSELISFLEQHPEPDAVMVMLFKNSLLDYVPKGEVYWGYQVSHNDSSKACSIHAVDGIVFCSEIVVTSVDYPAVTKASAYPNPAENRVTVNLPDGFNVLTNKIELFDSYGRNITNAAVIAINSISVSFDLSALISGVYHVRIQNGAEIIYAPLVKK